MKQELIRQMTVAIAISIPQDEVAFEMLQQSFINKFELYYRDKVNQSSITQGKRSVPIILDELINYTIKELPTKVDIGAQALSRLLLPERKVEISRRFLSSTMSEMLTILAGRNSIKESIRRYLHQKDIKNSYSVIESNRFDSAYRNFLIKFQESSAANYQFNGSYIGYVVHSFTSYYYPDKDNNLWSDLNTVDFAKRESETNLTKPVVLNEGKKDDIYVRDCLINIAEANDLLFTHSGQSEDVHGVHYDIYYMILNILCEELCVKINKELAKNNCGFELKLIDEQDRRETRGIYTANKGIANKISNAKMLISYIFNRVRTRDWDVNNIDELRDTCFKLGKKDRDGRNCVWKDVSFKAETSRYFDSIKSAHNYKAFNVIVKGVLSVLVIINALEERDWCIVDVPQIYEKVFKRKEFPRSLDYISAFWAVDLVDKLKAESEVLSEEFEGERGELLTFDEMVHEYAGSEQNNHENIRTNRYLAYSRGFNETTRTKQSGDYQSSFEQLLSVADYLTAFPRGFDEYIFSLVTEKRLPPRYGTPIRIEAKDIIMGKYYAFNHNIFFSQNRELAEYYLYGIANGQDNLDGLGWNICNSLFPLLRFCKNIHSSSKYEEEYCIYIPMVDTFLCCPAGGQSVEGKLPAKHLSQLLKERNEYFFDNTWNATLAVNYVDIPESIFSDFVKISKEGNRSEALSNSLGFSSMLGVSNYTKSEIKGKTAKIPVYHEYKHSVEKYVQHLAGVSELQLSFIDLLQTMLTFGLYNTKSFSGNTSAKQGYILVNSLLKSEFCKDNLDWFFSQLELARVKATIKKIDYSFSNAQSNKVDFIDVDLSIMDILTPNEDFKCEEGTILYELKEFLREYDNIPDRFVQTYNFLNTRLSFLRILRDAYSLAFHVVRINDLSLLGCELDSKFKLSSTLLSYKDSNMMSKFEYRFALIDSLPKQDVVDYVIDIRRSSWQHFHLLCEKLCRHFDECRQDVANLVDYDIIQSSDMRSKFQDYGSMFYTMPVYTDENVLFILKDIKPKSHIDDSGFLMCRNVYFRGYDGNNVYYVHSTGRMLAVGSTLNGPVNFDFSQADDLKRYKNIIQEGKKFLGW